MPHTIQTKLRLRILYNEQIAIGPGKAELLEAIQRTGSISQAAKSMNMSYRRAWQLVDTMNQCFTSALVETQTGGTHGGGAIVTPLGQQILRAFREVEKLANQTIQSQLFQISQHLKD